MSKDEKKQASGQAQQNSYLCGWSTTTYFFVMNACQ
jgi:hypothetical protein